MCVIEKIRYAKLFFAISIMLSLALLLRAQPSPDILINNNIQLIALYDSVFVHVSWDESTTYGRFSSNGMIIIKNGEAVMIDTPMNNEKTRQLISFVEDTMNVEVKKLIVGHFHSDCLGGLDFVQSKNIPSLANRLTIEKCHELKLPVPSVSFQDSLIFDFNGQPVECRFFGGGHTFDNIVVWLPQTKILFGGCLIRAMQSQSPGNLSDADIEHWQETIHKIINQYPNTQIVVPGHGNYGGMELLTHTIALIETYQNREK